MLAAVRTAAPGLALGIRLSADSEAARAIAPALAPLVDYIHLAVGNSATFDGCTGIAPPPPTPQDLIGELTEPFKLGPPLIATTRVVDPAHADALIGARCRRRVRDDPRADHRPRDAAQGAHRRGDRVAALHRLQRLHRPLPRRDADPLLDEPAHRA